MHVAQKTCIDTGLIRVSDIAALASNIVYINNHWSALAALKDRYSDQLLDLVTFRDCWLQFTNDTDSEAAKANADKIFSSLMDAQQSNSNSGAERPARATFDCFVSALCEQHARAEPVEACMNQDQDRMLDLSADYKASGNGAYRADNWDQAILYYTRALDAIHASDVDNEHSGARLRLICILLLITVAQADKLSVILSNRAAARSLAERGLDALSDCEHCVELQPTYWRGLKRRADCLAALGVWDRSIQDLAKVRLS